MQDLPAFDDVTTAGRDLPKGKIISAVPDESGLHRKLPCRMAYSRLEVGEQFNDPWLQFQRQKPVSDRLAGEHVSIVDGHGGGSHREHGSGECRECEEFSHSGKGERNY